MSLQTVNKAYSQTFSSSTTWTVNHNLGVSVPVVDVYNNSDERIVPLKIEKVNTNTLTIEWSSATTGRVFVV